MSNERRREQEPIPAHWIRYRYEGPTSMLKLRHPSGDKHRRWEFTLVSGEEYTLPPAEEFHFVRRLVALKRLVPIAPPAAPAQESSTTSGRSARRSQRSTPPTNAAPDRGATES